MKAIPNKPFPEIEENILEFWTENQTFEKSVNSRSLDNSYVFFDGPPFATGLPHYGHLLAGTIKDIVPRYWTMRGSQVSRVFGWDCHGLPVEFEVEKSLGLRGKSEVVDYGVAKFNEKCREIVLRYTEEWKKTVQRMGRWVDFENGYKTMDLDYMESIWWVFKSLWDKGLIYEGQKVVRYSPRIAAVLSNFEANLNYKTIQDPSITIKFKVDGEDDTYFLGWTTTPWTLISNLALTVGPTISYVKIQDQETKEKFYLAESRLGAYYKKNKGYDSLDKFKGKELEGKSYEPLFPYFSEEKKNKAFRVLLGDYVTAEDGTAIVHTAPAFGEDDFYVCQQYKIKPVDPIDDEGRFTNQITEYAGMLFKDADKEIIKDLKKKEVLIKHETISHSYPFCYRSDQPLIFKLIPTWYVKVENFKKQLIDSNDKINWVPHHIKEGRFGKWLKDARDWAISRNRFWGCPLPIWKCDKCGDLICIGDRKTLEQKSGEKVTDLHIHFVDSHVFSCEVKDCSGTMKRIPEVFDCWFESGSMPYAQSHYPFENKEFFEDNFPADFIAEGLDQTRGWFYTLNVLSTALFNKPPFKNVVVNGIILAEDGHKMSKSLKNYPDPNDIIDTYGADALRLYLINSPLLKAENLCFSEEGVKNTVRSVILPFWNAYSFFVTYAKIDNWEPHSGSSIKRDFKSKNELDRWIISQLQSLIKKVNVGMAKYHLYTVVPALVDFLDQLTNWYIRRSRRRFWAKGNGDDKEDAYNTLYGVLTTYIKLTAPIIPFITEEIYQNLVVASISEAPESVHLCDYPEHDDLCIDLTLEQEMQLIQGVVALGRNLRATNNLKVRQPLSKITIITPNSKDAKVVDRLSSIICEELNIKSVEYSNKESDFVSFAAKANMKVLGPKLGKRAKEVMTFIQGLSDEEICKVAGGNQIKYEDLTLSIDELVLYRTPKEDMAIETDFGITVAVDTKLTPDLINEGNAREIVSRIQKIRKNAGLAVEDHIAVYLKVDDELKTACEKHLGYIKDETLSNELSFTFKATDNIYSEEHKINEKLCQIGVRKV